MYRLDTPQKKVPQNGWFIRENLIKMDDLGGPTPIFGNTQIVIHVIRTGAKRKGIVS